MVSIKKILVPVDISEASPKLAPYVLTMAVMFDAEIHLLFVGRILQYFTGFYMVPASINDFEKSLLDGAEKRLYEFKDEYFKTWSRIKTTVVLGDISEEILNYIEPAGIDLLIMGTHGRKGLDKAFFGSIAERVIKASPVPVLVVNPYRNKSS